MVTRNSTQIPNAPVHRLCSDLAAVLRPFLDQSTLVTSIIAIGCHGRESCSTNESAPQIDDRCDTVLLQLVSDGDDGLAIGGCEPIQASEGGSDGEQVYTLESVSRKTRELLNDASGESVLLLPTQVLEKMVVPLGSDFGFRAVVAVASRRSGELDNENRWRLQRALFDNGLVCIGFVEIADGQAHCFLASDSIRSLSGLGSRSRGQITMSSLGTNGRFANQLFQYAYVKLYALRHGLNVLIPVWQGRHLFDSDDPLCADVALPELRFDPFTNAEGLIWDEDNPPLDFDLWGYCQEIPECWRRHRHLLRRLFTLSDKRGSAFDGWRDEKTLGGRRTLVAVHVRRGDYRDLQRPDLPWFRLVPDDWYLAWLRAIWPKLRDPLLYIATDEPDVVRPIFHEFRPISAYLDATAQALPDYICDFEILRRADYLAICNSSFSRMAAILAEPSQKCFCPSFQRQCFEPYDPWIDPGFWARFEDSCDASSKRPRLLGPLRRFVRRVSGHSL